MRATVFKIFLVLAAIVTTPWPSIAGEVRSSVKSDSLTFPHLLVAVKDDDPTTRTLRFFFNGGKSLRIDQANIDRLVDATEVPGRVYITFIATSEIPEELEKFIGWDFDRARHGFYRVKAGDRSIRPVVKILLTFPNVQEENKYVMGFVEPEDGYVIYRPPSRTAHHHSNQESNDVESTR